MRQQNAYVTNARGCNYNYVQHHRPLKGQHFRRWLYTSVSSLHCSRLFQVNYITFCSITDARWSLLCTDVHRNCYTCTARTTVNCWSQSSIDSQQFVQNRDLCLYTTCIRRPRQPPLGCLHQNIARTFGMEKLEWCGEKSLNICLFVLTEFTNVTDGRTHTDTAWRHRPRSCTTSCRKTAVFNAGGVWQDTDRSLLVVASIHTWDKQSDRHRLPHTRSLMRGTATHEWSCVCHRWCCGNAHKCVSKTQIDKRACAVKITRNTPLPFEG